MKRKSNNARIGASIEIEHEYKIPSGGSIRMPSPPKPASQPSVDFTQQLLDAIGHAAPRAVSPLRPSPASASTASRSASAEKAQSHSLTQPALSRSPPRGGERGRLSRTEAEVLREHGPLSQLNALYMRDAAEEEGEGEPARRRKRREELSQISAAGLALYTRLAECGVDAADRPFATVVVRRARAAAESWAQSFSAQS